MEALYKLQPNKVHSKKMQYMKVHHGEVHHEEVHHEEVQLKLQQHKSDRWEKTTVGILRHCTSCEPNKVHSKKMQCMKVHHGEVHHKDVHHEEVQLKLQRHKSDRWEKTTVGIWRHCTSCSPIRCIARRCST